MELSGAFVQHFERGNGICSSSSSLSCSILGDICTPEVLEQPGDLDLPNVKCKEESGRGGSFQSAFGSFSDKQVNNKVDSVSDESKFEKLVRNKKKKRKNKKKSYSTKEISVKIVSETGQSKNDVSNAKASSHTHEKEINSPAMNCEKSSDKEGCEEVSSNCLTEDSQESLSFRYSSQCKFGESMDIMPCEVCNSSHAITESNGFKCCNLASEHGAVNKTRHRPHIMKRQENGRLVWQGQKSVKETQTSEANKNLFVKNNLCLSKGLLPSSLIGSSGHIGAAYGITNAGNKGTKTYMRIHPKVFDESSRMAAQQRLNESLDQYVSQSSQVATCESVDCEEQKLKTNQFSMPHNDCISKKGLEYHGENFLRPHNKLSLCGREFLEVPFEQNYYKNSDMAQRTYSRQHVFTHCAPYLRSSCASAAYGQPTMACSTKFNVPLQCGFQPYSGMKMPGMNHVLTRSFHASANSESYMRVKQFNQHCFGEDVTSGINAKKWVPVGTKGSKILEKTDSASIYHVSDGDLPAFCKRVNESHSGGNIHDCNASTVLCKSKDTKLIDGHRMNISETEVPHFESQSTTKEVQYVESSEVGLEYVKKLKDIQQLIIGLQMVTDPLNAAYKMQLLSEGFELVMGCPLAEFERFLHSASPVITSSYLHEKCAACLGDQLSNISLCKHQIANTSLSTVWKWYEEPGNYGLKVKAGDSQNLEGLLAESTSFHAHFVPYLSAIQLFGYSNLSNSRGTSDEHANPDKHIRNSSTGKRFLAKDSVVKFDSVGEPVNSYEVFCSGGHSRNFIPSLLCSSNCELLFEFFETEIPPLRKPLHDKIVDLIDAEDSNLHVFGNPSKLKSLKLHDLHPASWFSVAWYPIYRIPEGKFAAAFLTYHSLGHLVQRDIPFDSVNKKTGCVVSPVVGLQSYNTKGECWFDLKRPVKSSFKESSPFNCSEILREQLKLLTENATLFAKGCVWKDGIKVFNRHRDYEFFCSRN